MYREERAPHPHLHVMCQFSWMVFFRWLERLYFSFQILIVCILYFPFFFCVLHDSVVKCKICKMEAPGLTLTGASGLFLRAFIGKTCHSPSLALVKPRKYMNIWTVIMIYLKLFWKQNKRSLNHNRFWFDIGANQRGRGMVFESKETWSKWYDCCSTLW